MRIGSERTSDFKVEDRLLTDVGGTIGSKPRFDVKVTEGDRMIGLGTHERRVIQVGQLG